MAICVENGNGELSSNSHHNYLHSIHTNAHKKVINAFLLLAVGKIAILLDSFAMVVNNQS